MANLVEAPLENIQYVLDADSKPVSVIVPIDVWRDLESERETAYLLSNETMRRRLLEAKNRQEGISFEDTRAKFEHALSKVSDAPPDVQDLLE